MHASAKTWGILSSDGTYQYADYLTATRIAGRTNNGVLAVRIMWGTLDEMTAELSQLYPKFASDDLRLIREAFGNLKFIYIYRKDVIAQAISLYRAERTDYWHSTENQKSNQQLTYDFGEIKSRVEMLNEHNSAWKSWFKAVDIKPLSVCYEEFSIDPISVTKGVLQFLEIDLPTSTRLEASNQRLADETTTAWIERFIDELESRTK